MTITGALGLVLASLILSTVMQYIKKFKGWLDAQKPQVIQAAYFLLTTLFFYTAKLFGHALPLDLSLWTSDSVFTFLASFLSWLMGMGWHSLKKSVID
jgi:hypothetical protein